MSDVKEVAVIAHTYKRGMILYMFMFFRWNEVFIRIIPNPNYKPYALSYLTYCKPE